MATSIWKNLQLTFAEEQLVVPTIPAEFKKKLKKLNQHQIKN
jgi:hypothetical protein